MPTVILAARHYNNKPSEKMETISVIDDNVVDGKSHLLQLTIGEYLDVARIIVEKNEFQRKRVKTSKTTYSLLKKDLVTGCVIPPIVLAHRKNNKNRKKESDMATSFAKNPEEFIILDGLQRSFTLIDIAGELSGRDLENFLDRFIRCEIYEGVNRAGILYRMLTLNTGQTTMSLRHQIEIMYLDYLDHDIDGVRLIREVDGVSAKKLNEYNFREMIEGFNSYVERNEMPMDKADILDNISGLENLAREDNDADLFAQFISIWHKFIMTIDEIGIEAELEDDESEGDDSEESKYEEVYIWAKNGARIFKRPQAVSGFGAALGLLKDEDQFVRFSDIEINLKVGAEEQKFLLAFNEAIATINEEARKIGNGQRLFFRMYFKILLMKDSGAYMNLYKAIGLALNGARRLGI